MRKLVMGLVAVALLAGMAIAQEGPVPSAPPSGPPAEDTPDRVDVMFEPAAYEAFEQWVAKVDPAELAIQWKLPTERHASIAQYIDNVVRKHDPPETRGPALYVRFPVRQKDEVYIGDILSTFANDAKRQEAARQLPEAEKALADAETRLGDLKQNPLLAALGTQDDERVTALLQATEKALGEVLVEAAGAQARVKTLRRHLEEGEKETETLKAVQEEWLARKVSVDKDLDQLQGEVQKLDPAESPSKPAPLNQDQKAQLEVLRAQLENAVRETNRIEREEVPAIRQQIAEMHESQERLRGQLRDAETEYATVEGRRKQLVENQQALVAFREAALQSTVSSSQVNYLRRVAGSTGDLPNVQGMPDELPWKAPQVLN